MIILTAPRLSKALSFLLISLLVLTSAPRFATAGGNPRVFAAFTYDPCVMCAVPGDAVFFNANTSISTGGPISSYTWNFGDGTPLVKTNSSLQTHVYFFNLTLAKWLVTLTVQDNLGSADSVSQLVEFNVAPSFTVQPSSPQVGWPATFNASATRVYQGATAQPPGFQWTFGDGTNGTGIVAAHRYQSPGLYRVSLTVTTAQGSPTISKILIVRPVPIRTQTVQASFDDLNVTILATIAVNNTLHTITGTISITVTNTTSRTLILSKTFDFTIVYGSGMKTPRFLIAINATHPLTAASCTVDVTTGQLSCFVSRDADINGTGQVGIVDFSMAAFDFNAVRGTPRYDPAVDIDNDGMIDIVDLGIIGADYAAPIY
jgi:PKD repeat protein